MATSLVIIGARQKFIITKNLINSDVKFIDLFFIIIQLSSFNTNSLLWPQVNNFIMMVDGVVDGSLATVAEKIDKQD